MTSVPALSSTLLAAVSQAKSDLAHVMAASEPLSSPTGVELALLAGRALPGSPPMSPPCAPPSPDDLQRRGVEGASTHVPLEVSEVDDAFGMARRHGHGLLDVFETAVQELEGPGHLVSCDVIRVPGLPGYSFPRVVGSPASVSNFLAFHDHFSGNDRIFLLERVLEIVSPEHILEVEVYHALEDYLDLCAAGGVTVQSMVHISGYIKDTSQDRLPSRMRRNLALYSLDVTELLARRDVCFMYCRHRQAKAINLHWREMCLAGHYEI